MKIQNLHDSDLDYPLQLIKQFPHSRLFSKDLDNFVYSEPQTKVCILFGVRRTGKTTAMLQCISRMAEKERKKAVFFQISKPRKKNDQILSGDSLWDLLKEMREYLHSGYKYFFVDEATNLLDFNQGAEILSDIIALQGAKIILSGTDSLCLDDARSDALLGRSVTISTSFISFSEWSLLTNSNEIDTFARQGGILGDGQQIQAIFGIDSGCTEYIQSAYARNIEHSIAERKISNIPDEVIDLIEEGRFEGAVQRIVEDLNLRITLKALRKEFSLSAIGSLRNLISEDYRRLAFFPNQNIESINRQYQAFQEIDEQQLIQWMALCLRIRDERELSNKLTIDKYIPISEIIVKFLKIEFARLQVLIPFPILKIQNDSSIIEQSKNLLIQHGLKYFQAKTMAECLFKTPAIKSLPIDDKKSLLIRMEQDILGHIIEEIVLIDLLKIKQSNKLDDIYICTLGLPSGEIDLALFNEKNHELALFEIKHSKTQNNNQARHLMNEKNISLINQSFKEYKIVRKTVLINNPHFEPFSSEDISWMDVSQFIREAEKNLFSAFIDPTTELNKDI